MKNECIFSKDRKYRYLLIHSWKKNDLFEKEEEKAISWIGLNPSTADENQLDPTLTRIRNFSESFGYNTFYMLNLFAFRATKPEIMKKEKDPVGPENDHIIKKYTARTDKIIFCCGNHGLFLNRFDLLKKSLNENKLYALKISMQHLPVHPLYQPADTNLIKL